jgi:hypothetical protein
MNSLTAYFVVSIAASTAASAALAYVWVGRQSPVLYLISTGALWIFISTFPLAKQPWEPTTYPPDFRHFITTLLWLAPFAILPPIALYTVVARQSTLTKLAVFAFTMSLVASPVSLLSGTYAACVFLSACL